MADPFPRTAVALLLLVAVKAFGRRWMAHWGASTDELDAVWPGDDLITRPDLTTTRAITVHARAAEVWPWVAQLGQGQGGVSSVDPGRSLVLRGGIPLGRTPSPFDSSWAFVLREQPDGTTRLVSRERYGYLRRWAALLVEPASVVSFVMSRRMLRGIAGRAERTPVPAVAA